jgi:spermidine synthase
VTQRGPEARSPWALYLIFFVSGCAGLVYEVMWTRSFGLVFGSTTRAASLVLATFFLGMALGNLAGARFARGSRSQALRSYAFVELAVAAMALLVLAWLAVYRQLYPALYQATFEQPALLTATQLGLAALALGPPCIGLGATLPLMSRAVVASEAHLGRRLGFVYAINTLGGVVGVLLAGFWLPVVLGVKASMGLAALLNCVAAAAAFRAARTVDPAAAPAAPPAAAHGPVRIRARSLVFVAIVSGFATLALEVVYTRLLVNAMDASVFSFAIVLASFLVALALGSALVSALADRVRTPWLLIGAGAWLGSVAIAASPALLRSVWLDTFEPPLWLGPMGAASLLLPITALVIGPPALLIGMVLPATWRAAIGRTEEAGALVGRLTGLNTLAGVVGSLAAGFVLIPLLGVSASVLLIVGLYLAIALLAVVEARRSLAQRLLATVAALGLGSLIVNRSWQVTPVIQREDMRLLAIDEGEGATVAVFEGKLGDRELIVDSRYTLGSSHGGRVHRSQGELPLALHGAPRSAAFIGVATGLSVSSIKTQPEIERVVAIELLPGVVRLAELFREANGGVLADPRVQIQLADGRNHLFGSGERFDVIVGDLFVPWHAGTGYLYTTEHFANVRERLTQGGVFAQWLQLDQASVDEIRSLTASFTTAFENAELWLNTLDPGRPLLAFVGYRGPSDAWRSVETDNMRRIAAAAALRDWSRTATPNTDDRPVIEFSAAANHFRSAARRQTEGLEAIAALRAAQERRSP